MAAAVFILLWVQNELTYDNYHKDARNIYRLTQNFKAQGWIWESTSLLLADAIKKEVPEVEITARLKPAYFPVFKINNNLAYEEHGAFVDGAWFKLFDYRFIEGNPNAFALDPNSIILTESEAKKYFGNHDALGKVIQVDSLNLIVKGIIQDAPANSSFQFTSYIPLSNVLKDSTTKANDEQWDNGNYKTFIRIHGGENPSLVAKKISSVMQINSGDKNQQITITLEPLINMHFDTSPGDQIFETGNKDTVYIFSLLGALILLIACINYVNLTTAKSIHRAKEVTIRKIVGAHRFHLFNQFLAEGMLVSCLALIATLIIIQWCLPAFNSITGKNFQLPLTSPNLWKVIGSTLIAAFILNSIYPAIVLSSFKPISIFRGIAFLKLKDSYLRKVLVTIQFTISVTLIAGTMVIYKQMEFIRHTNLGYNKSQVLIARVPPNINVNSKNEIINEVKQDLLAQTGIQDVSLANQSILNIGSYSTGSADWVGHDPNFHPKIAQLATDPNFAHTMQLQMKEGRWFEPGSEADKSNVVLNEEAIRELKIHQPYIGQRFTWKGKTGQIIGIVKDFHFHSLHDPIGPLVAFQNPDFFINIFMIRITPHSTTHSLADLTKTWNKFFPANPLEYHFLDDAFNELYKGDQQASLLILVFSLIAVVISSLGLFGLASFTAEKRAKEFSIRKVLGGSVAAIIRLQTQDFLKLLVLAIVIAFPIASIAMNKWLHTFAYRVNIGWWIFVYAGIFAIGIALITVSFQAIKSAVANPVNKLRTE